MKSLLKMGVKRYYLDHEQFGLPSCSRLTANLASTNTSFCILENLKKSCLSPLAAQQLCAMWKLLSKLWHIVCFCTHAPLLLTWKSYS